MVKKKSKLNKKLLLVGAIVLLGLIIAVLELTNVTHIFHKEKVPAVIPAHNNSGTPINSNNKQGSPSSSTSNSAPLPTDITQHTLVTPFGNFVSNHFPGQNGSPTTEASVCNTSPGATCYIKFTNVSTNQSTQLASQVTDARGTTSWYWDVSKDAHLTSGQWQVTAVATLGEQSKSATDTLKLTIQ